MDFSTNFVSLKLSKILKKIREVFFNVFAIDVFNFFTCPGGVNRIEFVEQRNKKALGFK